MTAQTTDNTIFTFLNEEKGFLVGLLTVIVFFLYGEGWLGNIGSVGESLMYFAVLFPVMLWLSFRVVHHADCLAIKLGEPYGTLILTLSVICIEVVMIVTVKLTGENNPTLGRDMMFSVLMIVLNGLVGISIIVGSFRHLVQVHNLQGANTFIIVLVVLSVLTLILPNFTQSTEAGTYSNLQMVFAILVSIGLYGAFLIIQTMRHQNFFTAIGEVNDQHHALKLYSLKYHSFFLLASMLPIVLLSKSMAKVIDYQIVSYGMPVALGGVFIAILVLSPEGMAAVKSALANRLQRSVNVCLGSALATIGLTVPALLIIGLVTGKTVVLGLDPVEEILLITTIVVSIMTFTSNKTNIIHGIVHLILFLAYFVMIFD